MPDLRIVEEPLTEATLRNYADIPISFTVESYLRLDPISNGLAGIRVVEVPVAAPYVKDYDLDEGEGPLRWAARWDTSSWTIIAAYEGERRVGGAVVAVTVEGMYFLSGRMDMAALWDIRVSPEGRRQGVGSALFRAATEWARTKGYLRLKIETQDVNVGACYFYARLGCELGGFNRHVYADHPEEVQLIWYYDLV